MASLRSGDEARRDHLSRGPRPVELCLSRRDTDRVDRLGLVSPDEPILDLAQAAWNFVPLVDDDSAAALGFDAIDYGRRLRLFLDAYGLEDRSGFYDALVLRKERDMDLPRFWGLSEQDADTFADGIREEIEWLAGTDVRLAAR